MSLQCAGLTEWFLTTIHSILIAFPNLQIQNYMAYVKKMCFASVAHVLFLRKPRYPEQHDPHNVAERGVVFWKHLDPQSALANKGGPDEVFFC